ncbi:MAG TPA: L-lactate dehydrogenase [Anaerolineales bacterium]|nr:L-lactate dehydrogenase [Anaerolineales bacterium]
MKVGIIGTGQVGATAAYSLVLRGIGREIVLVDLNKKRAQAEADDILHAVPFANPLHVSAGGYADLKGAKVVVISAGVSQKPGETRLELLERNANVFRAIIPEVLENAPETILLIATNPVDVMTHMAAHFARDYGVPSSRVIGSGTTLDTARFRALLGQKVGIDPYHVHAYVLGEHGDSEVIPWSPITVGVVPLIEFCAQWDICLDEEARQEIDTQVRGAAYRIIEGKGATYYGVGAAIARIVEAIISDQRALLTVCSRMDEAGGVQDVTLSLPHLIGGEGILNTLKMPLTQKETELLAKSANVIKSATEGLAL